MEPFFVANEIGKQKENTGYYISFFPIYYTDVPVPYIENTAGGADYIIIFTNSENNCYLSFYVIQYQEEFIIPARSYYCIIVNNNYNTYFAGGLFYMIRSGVNELPNVRIFHRGEKESILLKNINVRAIE